MGNLDNKLSQRKLVKRDFAVVIGNGGVHCLEQFFAIVIAVAIGLILIYARKNGQRIKAQQQKAKKKRIETEKPVGQEAGNTQVDPRQRLSYHIIVHGNLFVLERLRRCFRCNVYTPVIAFAIKDFFYPTDALMQSWELECGEILLIPHFSNIPDALAEKLHEQYNFYAKLGTNEPPSNHCKCCGCKQGEHYLFEEVYEPFEKGLFSGEPLDGNAVFHKVLLDEDYPLSGLGTLGIYLPTGSEIAFMSDEPLIDLRGQK